MPIAGENKGVEKKMEPTDEKLENPESSVENTEKVLDTHPVKEEDVEQAKQKGKFFGDPIFVVGE
jgi:hypothetical protein